MCIIILNRKGTIPKNVLKTCFVNNPDGMGIMYANRGKLETYKELINFDSFYQFYSNLRTIHNGNIGLHFRVKTHGTISEKNIHPFYINPNLAFMHNGIIQIEAKNTELSDTQLFNERILKNLPVNFVHNKAIIELISDYIDRSKLLFLDNKDNYKIINEEDGNWKDGNWYSNYSYLPNEYSWYDEEEACEICGKTLLSDIEYEEGYCLECLAKYSQTCQNCHQYLISDKEIEYGYCDDCLSLWHEYLPS